MRATPESNRFLLASNNLHKLDELRRLLADYRIAVTSPSELGLRLEVPETGMSFAENALLKARAFARAAGMPAIADDSGLAIDALGGAPGVYSARYGGPGLTDADRTRLVLDQLTGIPETKRSARFVAAIAVVYGTSGETFEGHVEGEIAFESRGGHGFGYDPIFLYPPLGKTFGEMRPDEKSMVSHRARALGLASRYIIGLKVPPDVCDARET